MKRIYSLFFFSALFSVGAFAQVSFSTPLKNESLTTLLEGHISAYPDSTQLAIAIIDGHNIDYVGVIRKGNSVELIDNSASTFEIGSITKVFTSILLASQIEQFTMNLDDPIQLYLPFPIDSSAKEITLEMLSNHTSGLPRIPSNLLEDLRKYKEDNPYRNYNENRLIEYLKYDIELNSEPGTVSEYSNLGAGLLGYILELHTGQTYEELLQQLIFEPIGMPNSSTFVNETTIVPGQDLNGEFTSNWDLNVLIGAGGIKSTIVDMARFARINLEAYSYFEMAMEPTFEINDFRKIGLGWNITDIPENNIQVYYHNGGTGGYRSNMIISRKNNIGVVILSNVSAYSEPAGSIDVLGREIMMILRND